MYVKYPVIRNNLCQALLVLSDYDYQIDVWVNTDRSKLTHYVGFEITAENLLNDVIWSEGDKLIGFVFRDQEELTVCLELVETFENFEKKMGAGLTDAEYINSTEWKKIIAAARNALRVLLKGDI
jgi:hypothetical protein